LSLLATHIGIKCRAYTVGRSQWAKRLRVFESMAFARAPQVGPTMTPERAADLGVSQAIADVDRWWHL